MATPIKVSATLDTTRFNAGVAGMTQQLKNFKSQGVEGAFTALKALKGGLIGTAVFTGFAALKAGLDSAEELAKLVDKANTFGKSLSTDELVKAKEIASALKVDINEVVGAVQKLKSGESLNGIQSFMAESVLYGGQPSKEKILRTNKVSELGRDWSVLKRTMAEWSAFELSDFLDFMGGKTTGTWVSPSEVARNIMKSDFDVKEASNLKANEEAIKSYNEAVKSYQRTKSKWGEFDQTSALEGEAKAIAEYQNQIKDLNVELQDLRAKMASSVESLSKVFGKTLIPHLLEAPEGKVNIERLLPYGMPAEGRLAAAAMIDALNASATKELALRQKLADVEEKIATIRQKQIIEEADGQIELEEKKKKLAESQSKSFDTKQKFELAQQTAIGFDDEGAKLLFEIKQKQSRLDNYIWTNRDSETEQSQKKDELGTDILESKAKLQDFYAEKSSDTIKSFFGRGMDFQVNDQQQHGGWGAGQQGVITNVNNAIIQQAKDISEMLQLIKRNAGGGIIQ